MGKSVVSRLLAQWFIDRSIPFAAVDGDLSHGALVRMYADYSQPVDLDDPSSADQIVDRALGADRRVLVDLPAQSMRSLWTWLSEANVFAFAKEAGIRMSFWHVTDGGFASVGEIERGLELFGDHFEHKVVKNFGRSKNFSQFEESSAKRRLDQLGGKTMDLPELDAQSMYKGRSPGLELLGCHSQQRRRRPEAARAAARSALARARLRPDRDAVRIDLSSVRRDATVIGEDPGSAACWLGSPRPGSSTRRS